MGLVVIVLSLFLVLSLGVLHVFLFVCSAFLFCGIVSNSDETRVMHILVLLRQPQVFSGIVKKPLDEFRIVITDELEWRSLWVCVHQ